jgi:uncharacterized membrane protein YdbT with pleckstrin-like domain
MYDEIDHLATIRTSPVMTNQDVHTWHFMCRPAWRSQLWLLSLSALSLGWGVLTSLGLVFGTAATQGQPQSTLALIAVTGIGWGPFAVSTVFFLYRHYQWRFKVEDGAITSTQGIIGRQTRSINVNDVRNVNVSQSFIQRLLSIGDVEFSSSGGSGIEVVFLGVRSPGSIADAIQQERRTLGQA